MPVTHSGAPGAAHTAPGVFSMYWGAACSTHGGHIPNMRAHRLAQNRRSSGRNWTGADAPNDVGSHDLAERADVAGVATGANAALMRRLLLAWDDLGDESRCRVVELAEWLASGGAE